METLGFVTDNARMDSLATSQPISSSRRGNGLDVEPGSPAACPASLPIAIQPRSGPALAEYSQLLGYPVQDFLRRIRRLCFEAGVVPVDPVGNCFFVDHLDPTKFRMVVGDDPFDKPFTFIDLERRGNFTGSLNVLLNEFKVGHRECPICGTQFKRLQANHKFCTTRCGELSRQKHHREETACRRERRQGIAKLRKKQPKVAPLIIGTAKKRWRCKYCNEQFQIILGTDDPREATGCCGANCLKHFKTYGGSIASQVREMREAAHAQ